MKLLKEISEKSLGIMGAGNVLGESFKVRKSARGVLFNDKGEVSLQFVSKYGYYKLPGGGVEKAESIEDAMRREMVEEVGCAIKMGEPIGVTIEYRNQHDIIHISYGYFVYVDGEIGTPAYEEGEIADGFEPVWYPLDEAIDLVESHRPKNGHYMGTFVVERELAFLKEAKKILDNK